VPSLAFRDLKPNKESVDSGAHLNPVTCLPAHKQSWIEEWLNPRADEKLDQLESRAPECPGGPCADSSEYS
jgi:hypothetical protein